MMFFLFCIYRTETKPITAPLSVLLSPNPLARWRSKIGIGGRQKRGVLPDPPAGRGMLKVR